MVCVRLLDSDESAAVGPKELIMAAMTVMRAGIPALPVLYGFPNAVDGIQKGTIHIPESIAQH